MIHQSQEELREIHNKIKGALSGQATVSGESTTTSPDTESSDILSKEDQQFIDRLSMLFTLEGATWSDVWQEMRKAVVWNNSWCQTAESSLLSVKPIFDFYGSNLHSLTHQDKQSFAFSLATLCYLLKEAATQQPTNRSCYQNLAAFLREVYFQFCTLPVATELRPVIDERALEFYFTSAPSKERIQGLLQYLVEATMYILRNARN